MSDRSTTASSPELGPDDLQLDPVTDPSAAASQGPPAATSEPPLFGKWGGFGAALVTGLLYYISFPGVDFWPAAFIAWVPWMLALKGGATPKQAVWQGLGIGLVTGAFGFYWLLEMLQTFSGFPTYLCAAFASILFAYQGGLFALLGWIYTRAAKRGWPAGFAFTCAFVAGETAWPLLFPFTFGASLHDVFPLVQMAELGGPILVALVALAPNWALAIVLEKHIRARRGGKKLSLTGAFDAVGARRWAPLMAVPLVAGTYGMVRIVQVDEAVRHAEKVRVGIVQANMSLMAKRMDRKEGLRRHTELTRKLRKDEKIDLVVWPETSVAGAINEKTAFKYYRRNVTARLKVPAIVGAVLFRDVDDERGSVLFNSALISDDQGRIQARYDKQFLLLFGEHLPFGDKFPVLHKWSPNSGRFTPGTSYEPLTFHGHDIATFICYEDIVPSFVNDLMKHGEPELLVNMTNDAWFGDSSEPWEHMALAKLRAVEQRRFMVRSTNSGISGFVDPVGRLIKQTETFEQAAIAEDVAWLKLGSPFRLWGTWPWRILSGVGFVMAFISRRRFFPDR